MLHQQTSMCSPMSPILSAQNLIDNPSAQLLRSKSLNDISNNSLLAPDLAINFQGFQQHQQRQTGNSIMNTNAPNLIGSYDTRKQLNNVMASPLHQTSNGTTCMAMPNYYDQEYDAYHQQPGINGLHAAATSSNNHAFNDQLVNGQFNQQQAFYRDSNDNQCSNNSKQSNPSATNSASSTNMFNICNPILMNLNGVTEQIGNLHL